MINYPLNKGQWVSTKVNKKYIVWHCTEGRTVNTPYKGSPGRATTSIDSWNENTARVGAPYLIDRDGTVYKTFPDDEWIYHLNIPGSNGSFDKTSIAIEFANEAGLVKVNNTHYAFDRIDANTIYNGPVISYLWRGYSYLADFTEAQIDAGIELTLDLCKRFNIKPKFYRDDTFNANAWTEATIIRHSTINSNKADMYLAPWIWEKISSAGIEV